MVSFQCHACGDVVKKPKLDQHRSRCYAGFDCIDCSTSFNTPAEYKGHTSCISEAEKYQKSMYKGPRTKRQTPAQNGTSKPTIASVPVSSEATPTGKDAETDYEGPDKVEVKGDKTSKKKEAKKRDVVEASTPNGIQGEDSPKKDSKKKKKHSAENEAGSAPRAPESQAVDDSTSRKVKKKKAKKGSLLQTNSNDATDTATDAVATTSDVRMADIDGNAPRTSFSKGSGDAEENSRQKESKEEHRRRKEEKKKVKAAAAVATAAAEDPTEAAPKVIRGEEIIPMTESKKRKHSEKGAVEDSPSKKPKRNNVKKDKKKHKGRETQAAA